MKLLSVAVPAYNMEKYLDKCLSPFLGGRLSCALEVLIIDDGSSDATATIAQRYVDQRPDIFLLIHQENGGHGGAVNTALQNATGRYFRVLDADDWMDADKLAALIELLGREDADLFVDECTDVDLLSGAYTEHPLPDDLPDSICDFDGVPSKSLIPFYNIHAITVRTALLKEKNVELLRHTFYVDYQFLVSATAFAQTVRFVRLPVSFYLLGNAEQSVHHDNYVRRYADHDRVLHACLKLYEERGYPPERGPYVFEAVKLLIHTQLNISLLYDRDRRQGKERAKALKAELKNAYPALWRAVKKRYAIATVLHAFKVDDNKLKRIRKN